MMMMMMMMMMLLLLLQILVQLLLYIVIVNSSNDDQQCEMQLVHVIDIPTEGNAGFEYFTKDDKHYLLSANFWDGISKDMSATSHLIQLHIEIDSNRIESYDIKQSYNAKGAHGVDYFTIGSNSFMIIPSYYGCNQHDSQLECFSTIIYIYNDNTNQFDVHQQIFSSGPSQTDHYETSIGEYYIVIAENFANKVTIMKMNQNNLLFENFQSIDCIGVAAIAFSFFQ
jgi:hypothetical protein